MGYGPYWVFTLLDGSRREGYLPENVGLCLRTPGKWQELPMKRPDSREKGASHVRVAVWSGHQR